MDLDPLLPLPGVELFEKVRRYQVSSTRGAISLSYGVEEVLEDGALACAMYDEIEGERVITLLLSADSYEDLEKRGGRARFSVAHEIGHAVLHADRLIDITKIDHKRRAMLRSDATPTPPYRDSEWQANAFAAGFLMPGPGLEYLEKASRLTPRALSRMYGVSELSATHRISAFDRNRVDILTGWR
ncbi:MAG TPA: ImmA/IrrE family metallo-endopeptidase [Thermoanaerobaculia bacterium]|jgi:hypothetical protein